jgi:hypothetical protein
MNILLLAAPVILAVAAAPVVQQPDVDETTIARVTGTMVSGPDKNRGEPAPGVQVTLIAARRNTEGLLEAALEGLKDCKAPVVAGGQEPYGFCVGTTNAEGRFEFSGMKPGLYVLTSDKDAAKTRKLPDFGHRAVCELRAGMTNDVGRVQIQNGK